VTPLRWQQREQDRQKRIRETARKLKQELEREGFYVSEGFDEVNLAVGDSPYKHGRDAPRAATEIVLGDEDGPYAADRRAGRRSSVMVPGEMNSKFPLAYYFRRNYIQLFVTALLIPSYVLPFRLAPGTTVVTGGASFQFLRFSSLHSYLVVCVDSHKLSPLPLLFPHTMEKYLMYCLS